jgi:acyl-CoA synthetase (AMP-forming)/AMP-acid ligase II
VIDEYWQAEEKTRELFLGEWMTVGDIARKDEEGFYFICDRAVSPAFHPVLILIVFLIFSFLLS